MDKETHLHIAGTAEGKSHGKMDGMLFAWLGFALERSWSFFFLSFWNRILCFVSSERERNVPIFTTTFCGKCKK